MFFKRNTEKKEGNGRFFKKVILTGVVFTLISALSSYSFGYNLMNSHLKTGSTWYYSVGSDITSVYAITCADNQWNSIANRKVTLANNNYRNNATGTSRNMMNEIFKTTNLLSHELMRTTTYASNGITVEADIAINSTKDWSGSSPVPSDKYSVKTAMAHEMGHVIGIADHFATYSPVPLMYYGYSRGEERSITDYDIECYNAISW